MDNRQCEIINNLNNWFEQFWSDRNVQLIDEEGNYKKIATNRFSACMMYIYDNYVSRLEYIDNKGIKQYLYIDYITILEWYISKIREYDIISLDGFQCLFNRSAQWFYNIRDNTDNISNSFIIDIIDISNNSVCDIDNINNSVCCSNSSNSNNSNDIAVYLNGDKEKATLLLLDITKKLYRALQDMTANKLNDTPIGLVTNANNNNDIGLNYAKERIQETAKARQLISLNDLPLIE